MVTLSGKDLTLDGLVAVARHDEPVQIGESAFEAMAEASSLAEHIFERGLPTYGLTTGLGAQKRTSLRRDDDSFSWRQIAESHVGQGPDAPREVVRAAMLVLLNQFCGGSTCVRPVNRRAVRGGAERGGDPARQVARLSGRLRPGPDGGHRARGARRHGPRPRRRARPDQLQRLRHGYRGAGAGRHRAAARCRGRRRRPGAGGVRRQCVRARRGDRRACAPTRPSSARSPGSTTSSPAAFCGRRGQPATCRTR